MEEYKVYYFIENEDAVRTVKAENLFHLTQRLYEELLYTDQLNSIYKIELIK